MTAKVQIVEQLGEAQVLLPELLAAALEANDRAKVRMTLLAGGGAHAQNPASPPSHARRGTARRWPRSAGFRIHRQGCARARTAADSPFRGRRRCFRGLYADIDTMMAPLRLARPEKGEEFAKRLDELAVRRTAGGGRRAVRNPRLAASPRPARAAMTASTF